MAGQQAVRGRRRASALVALAVALGASVAGVIGAVAPAQADSIDFAFDFGTVKPGETISDSGHYELPTAATVTAVRVSEPISSTDGEFRAQWCSAVNACVDVQSLEGRQLDAGNYTLTVTLDVADSVGQGVTLQTEGQITLVQDDAAAGLAQTGGGSWMLGGAIAGGMILVGWAALRLGRSRREGGAR